MITEKEKQLEIQLKLAHNKLIDYVAKVSNYQTEVHAKNIQIINLKGELSRAHNTTKIVAFVLVVTNIITILYTYFN